MKYYDLYEPLYRKIRSSSKPTWDAFFDSHSTYEDFWTRRFIDAALPRLALPPGVPRALELGCGAGQACCYLASRGFEVSGVDISPTAIAMAQAAASERELDIRFQCRNVMQLDADPDGRTFEVIVDGNCLHCVVFDEERASVYRRIRALLSAEGYFLVSTMIWSPGVVYPQPLCRDERGILWAASEFVGQLVPEAATLGHEGAPRPEKQYLPYRRVLAAEQLRQELSDNGFEIVWEHIEPPRQAGSEPMFQAVLRDPAGHGRTRQSMTAAPRQAAVRTQAVETQDTLDESELRRGIYALLEEAEQRRKRDQHEVPTAFDKSMWQLAVLLARLDPRVPWEEGCRRIPGSEGEHVREALRILTGLVSRRRAGRYVDYRDRVRRGGCDMTPAMLAMSSGIGQSLAWKGMPLFKTTFDMAIYSTLIWELQPALIVEIGSGNGASAIWLADLLRMFGMDGRVVSFDCRKVELSCDRVSFIQGDCWHIERDFDRRILEERTGALLVLEDAHVNVPGVLAYFHTSLRKGDYLIVEDSYSKKDALLQWLAGCDDAYRVDTRYVDMFGQNVTSAQDSVFVRL